MTTMEMKTMTKHEQKEGARDDVAALSSQTRTATTVKQKESEMMKVLMPALRRRRIGMVASLCREGEGLAPSPPVPVLRFAV